MRTTYEFRVREEYASLLFDEDEGRRLSSGLIRLVRMSEDDPRLQRIGELQHQLQKDHGKPLYFGWSIIHNYTNEELENAFALTLWPTRTFEPAGEQCGTVYNDGASCPICGAGAPQMTRLFLDTRRIPARADIARTIAGEIVVSPKMAATLTLDASTDLHLGEIRGAGDLEGAVVESKTGTPWRQLRPVPEVSIVEPTRFGIEPFDEDAPGEYRCPRGDTLGLNLLSELTMSGAEFRGHHIARTRQYIGIRRGVLRPQPRLVISQQLRQALLRDKIRGYRLEIAHLKD